MSTVGVRDLKNGLTRYLRQTKRGEEIVVTERGRPVAVIQPIRGVTKSEKLETRLAALAAEGLLILPTRKRLSRIRMVSVKGPSVSQTVLEARR